MKSPHYSLLGLLVLFFFFSSCSDTAGSGSGTGTGNPIIIGTVTDTAGKIVANATVIVRPIDYSPYDTSLDFLTGNIDSLGYAYSDEKGKFSVEVTDTGKYYIQIVNSNKSRTLGISDSIHVVQHNNFFDVQEKKVSKLDTLKGSIHLLGGDLCPIVVRVVGKEVADTIESGQEFKLPLPKGIHNFIIEPLDKSAYPAIPYWKFPTSRYIGNEKILAFKPISDSRACDSLIVHHFMAFNKIFETVMANNHKAGGDLVIEYYQIDSLLKHHTDLFETSDGRITTMTFDQGQVLAVFQFISGLNNLKSLTIENSSIEYLPSNFGQLSQLDTLRLKYNNLSYLPTSITNLVNTSLVELDSNKIAISDDLVKEWADEKDPDWATTQKQ